MDKDNSHELSERDHSLIDNFLRNNLDPKERIEFDERLQDPHFSEELDLRRDISPVFESIKRDKQKEILKSVERKFRSKSKNNRRTMLITCIVLLAGIALLSLFYLTRDSERNDVELFAQFYEPYPNVISPIERAENEGEDMFQWYELGEYMRISNLDIKRFDREEQFFYYGLALVALENCPEAIEQLQFVKTYEDRFFDASSWYIALCYVRSRNRNDAIYELEELVKEGSSPLQDRARLLLKEIK